jgi:hypothetical protein
MSELWYTRYALGAWTDLDELQARTLTERIRQAAEHLYELLYEAHERKAWKALGYATFQAYVQAEFQMTRQRAYQLLDQAKVVREISAAATTPVDIPERTARKFKPVLAELTQKIRLVVSSGPPEQAERRTLVVLEAAKRAYNRDRRAQRRRQPRATTRGQEERHQEQEAEAACARTALAEPWADDRGLSLADSAILDAHHSAWTALKVLQGLDLDRVAKLLTESERAECAADAEAMRGWLDRYLEVVAPLAKHVS